MSYVYVIRCKHMNKAEKFEDSLQELSRFAKVLSHPARLAILKYLAETKTCISGDISDYLPLGRTTVSQHLKELRDSGLIHGEIDGLKVNYCLCSNEINRFLELFEIFFSEIKSIDLKCSSNDHHQSSK
jgi:DNA-binding transcriptional ArsR family regulator